MSKLVSWVVKKSITLAIPLKLCFKGFLLWWLLALPPSLRPCVIRFVELFNCFFLFSSHSSACNFHLRQCEHFKQSAVFDALLFYMRKMVCKLTGLNGYLVVTDTCEKQLRIAYNSNPAYIWHTSPPVEWPGEFREKWQINRTFCKIYFAIAK